MCIRGGKVNDILSAILHLPESTNLENIIIQVGSNDCVSDDFDKDTFPSLWYNLMLIDLFFILQQESLSTK
jgi:hypothetical protein